MKYYIPKRRVNPTTERFIFATGIECSYPTIKDDTGKTIRQDSMEKSHHYERWKEDMHLCKDLGIHFLRYGPPWHRIHLGPNRYDWDWIDTVLQEMQRLEITPLIDLCHFGVPDWIENFQNPDFPRHLAAYATMFSKRYPWVRFYTPVNEIYIAAEFSGRYGWWNERLKTHHGFVTALKHLVRGNVEAMMAILKTRHDALFIQSESSEYTHASHPDLVDEAEMLNERRFLSLDLNYGRRVGSGMYEYLLENGMTKNEYEFFLRLNLREHCILGNDYYRSNEHLLLENGQRVCAGEIFGYYVLTREYYSRFNLPMMHTETNYEDPNAEQWLWKTWANIQRLRRDGIPICGMTWYSLTDQVDWDTALRQNNGRINPLGLYDLNRKLRPVGRAYKNLIQEWNFIPLLPNGPLTIRGKWSEPSASIAEGKEDEEPEREVATFSEITKGE